MYRTLVRGYRVTSNRIGLATFSLINIVVCYALTPYSAPANLNKQAGDIFSQVLALRQDDRIFLYLLVGIALFTLASFVLTWVGVKISTWVSHDEIHSWPDEFRLLRFFPHVALSTGLMMASVIGTCEWRAAGVAQAWGYDGASVRKIIAWSAILFLGSYMLIIWPRQALLVNRKNIRKWRDALQPRNLIIVATLLLSSFLPCYFAYRITSVAYDQSSKVADAVSPEVVGVECGVVGPKGDWVFYIKVRNPGSVPVLVRELSLSSTKMWLRVPVKIQKNEGELVIIEAKAIKILAAVPDNEGISSDNKGEHENEIGEFCQQTDISVTFDQFF